MNLFFVQNKCRYVIGKAMHYPRGTLSLYGIKIISYFGHDNTFHRVKTVKYNLVNYDFVKLIIPQITLLLYAYTIFLLMW